MSAEEHKEQIKGEVSDDGNGNDGMLSVLPSKRKLLLGGAVVVVAVVAYKMLTRGDEDGEGENKSTEIDVDSSTLGERLRDLDEEVSTDSDVEVSDGEDKSFEEKQEAAAEELHEDTPEYGGGE